GKSHQGCPAQKIRPRPTPRRCGAANASPSLRLPPGAACPRRPGRGPGRPPPPVAGTGGKTTSPSSACSVPRRQEIARAQAVPGERACESQVHGNSLGAGPAASRSEWTVRGSCRSRQPVPPPRGDRRTGFIERLTEGEGIGREKKRKIVPPW